MDLTFLKPEDLDCSLNRYVKYSTQALIDKLAANGCCTVRDIFSLNDDEMSEWKGFGRRKTGLAADLRRYIWDELNGKEVCMHTEKKVAKLPNPYAGYSDEKLIFERKEMEYMVGMSSNDKKRYALVMEELRGRGMKMYYELDDIMFEIPVDLCFQFNLIDSKIWAVCQCLKLSVLADIYELDYLSFIQVQKVGNGTWRNIVDLKKKLRNDPSFYAEKYRAYGFVHVLPKADEHVLMTMPLAEKIDLVFEQYADILEKQNFVKEADFIRGYFLELKTLDQMALERNVSKQTMANYRDRCITNFMAGADSNLGFNICVSDELIEDINELAEEFSYQKVSDVMSACKAKSILQLKHHAYLYGMQIIESHSSYYLEEDIFVRAELIKRDIVNALSWMHYYLNDRPEEITMLNMLEDASTDDKYAEWWDELLTKYVKWCKRTEWNGKNLRYKYENLSTAECRIGRIIYDRRNEDNPLVTYAELANYPGEGDSFANCASKAAQRYPWIHSPKQGVYYYKTDATVTIGIREAVRLYAEEHVEFSFKQMMDDFLTKGMYTSHKEKSFRAAAMLVCQPNNNDSDLLRLSSEIADDDLNWRTKSKRGISNWIIKSMIAKLQSCGNKWISRQAMLSHLKNLDDANIYRRISNNFNSIISKYTCKEEEGAELFYINDNECVKLNTDVLECIDTETIGFVDKKPAYYMDVITNVVNSLKAAKDSGFALKLSDLQNSCRSIISPNAPTTIFYRIVRQQLPEEIERFEKNGIQYLRYLPAKQVVEEYAISTQQPETSAEGQEPEIVKVETDRPMMNYMARTTIDKSVFVATMVKELDYYNRLWDLDDISLEEGIEDFVEFMLSSDNSNISVMLSRSMFEFFCYKHDKYDLYHQLTDIVLSYESFVRDIYLRVFNGVPCRTSGLQESISLISELYEWAYPYSRYTQAFQHIFGKLKKKRNFRSHGESLGLDSADITQSASSFIALYIYTLARFGRY